MNPTTVGRADGNLFQIIEPSVSGRHCEILLRGNEIIVRDLKSTNGTFIQGERITEATLKPGQILRLGRVDLRLQISTPVASLAPGAPSPSVPKPTSAPAPTPPASLPQPRGRMRLLRKVSYRRTFRLHRHPGNLNLRRMS